MDPVLIFVVIAVAGLLFMSSRTRKQQRAASEFRNNLGPGDEVMTHSGLLGTVVDVEDDVITLESAPGSRSRWIRAAISKKIEPPVDEISRRRRRVRRGRRRDRRRRVRRQADRERGRRRDRRPRRPVLASPRPQGRGRRQQVSLRSGRRCPDLDPTRRSRGGCAHERRNSVGSSHPPPQARPHARRARDPHRRAVRHDRRRREVVRCVLDAEPRPRPRGRHADHPDAGRDRRRGPRPRARSTRPSG